MLSSSPTGIGAPATRTHTRHNASVLATCERDVLVWLATRMPVWVTSDRLTWLGAAGMAGVGCALAAAPASRRWLALVPVFLAINWFGDSLDGTLARVRHAQRPRYGYYVDHVVGPGQHARALRRPCRVWHCEPTGRRRSAGDLPAARSRKLPRHPCAWRLPHLVSADSARPNSGFCWRSVRSLQSGIRSSRRSGSARSACGILADSAGCWECSPSSLSTP